MPEAPFVGKMVSLRPFEPDDVIAAMRCARIAAGFRPVQDRKAQFRAGIMQRGQVLDLSFDGYEVTHVLPFVGIDDE